MLQPSDHLCGPPLDSLQQVHVLLMLGAPELNTVLLSLQLLLRGLLLFRCPLQPMLSVQLQSDPSFSTCQTRDFLPHHLPPKVSEGAWGPPALLLIPQPRQEAPGGWLLLHSRGQEMPKDNLMLVTGTAAEVGKHGKGEFWSNDKNRKYCP